MENKKSFFQGFIIGIIVLGLVVGFIEINSTNLPVEDSSYSDSFSKYEEKLKEIFLALEEEYIEDIDLDLLLENSYNAFVDGIGDPYTTYYSEEEYKYFMQITEGRYQGIGVVISYGETNDTVVVEAPYKGSPGQKAGLLPRDIILEVDGEKVRGMDIARVANLIKGEKGTNVLIKIYRKSEEKEIEFNVTRDIIDIPTVEYEVLENKIGYITISSFDQVTYKQFVDAYKDLEKQDINGLIIDVRNNPGGLIHVVAAISDIFIPKGETIVYTKTKSGKQDDFKAKEKQRYNKPLVVLINHNSASASEIFAGAIKDYELGTIVGTKSFGKGLVQSTYELEDGSALKITVAKYYTPKSGYIHEKGIEPNVVVEMPEELKDEYFIEKSKDLQLIKAIEIINKKIKE